jgi:HemY protein
MRAAFLVLVLALIAFAAAWFAENPGAVAIDWGDWRVETTAGVAVGGVALLAVVVALLYRAWRWVRTSPRRLRERQEHQRRLQGYRALTRGLVAVAAGDADESQRLAKRAEALLEEPPLTLLLSAQAAQLNGDDRAAEKYFQAMLANPELEFLGLRGLLTVELRRGDTAAALEHARRAYRLRPQSEWTQSTLLELQLTQHQWKQAEALLIDSAKRRGTPEATLRRRRAVLLLEQAADIERTGDRAGAASIAERAHHAAPEFVPAAVASARLQNAIGKPKRALHVLETTWRLTPHPDLAAELFALWPQESPARRLARVQQFVASPPGHAEGLLTLARAALEAADWGLARRSLESLGGGPLEARVCRLWAELEDAEHGPGPAARDWLLRATGAPADPAWTCSRCSGHASLWQPTCPHCGSFDTLQWQPAPLAPDALALDAKVASGAAALARPEVLPPRERLAAPIRSAEINRGSGAAAAEITPPPAAGEPADLPVVLPMPPDVPVIRPESRPSRRFR